MQRVLRPGGRLIILEFTQPYFWFRPFYYLYLQGILPWVARWLTGDRDAYLYLGTSIAGFRTVKDYVKKSSRLVLVKYPLVL